MLSTIKTVCIFRNTCGDEVRRPQFGMYTGRTPYPGAQPSTEQDRKLEKTLARMSFPQSDSEQEYFNHLLKEGKIPAKADMHQFLQGLHESRHIPNDEDAELITRFEMQQFCPDILITNYSMLEYMLLRPREQKIWDDTREWLASNNENKLLFVIDEAHMYRGSSGGEVALLIRRLFHKLGISRNRVQFILTTASMPNKNQQDVDSVMKFANELTASDKATRFCYLTGEREVIDGQLKYDIPAELLLSSDPSQFEDKDDLKLSALLSFWRQLEGFDQNINSLEAICNWMYDNLVYYRPFHELIKYCRGNAVSLGELSYGIFPDLSQENALKAVSVLLAIAPLVKNAKGSVLFPARMHMLFKGISGVYACANANCSRSHSEGGLTLGEVYLSDGNLICPHCGSVVYELYNDRRCGALFFKGYVLEDDSELHGNVYLWRYPGQLMDHRMKEVHLFIPTDDFELPAKQGKNAIKPCYLDVKSGFINFTDDSSAGKSWLNRAAQSLAEALRLVASKKLDVEFTELVTGYRLRTGAEASYVDIYLYDSLSSGAGYAVSVADAIAELLSDMKELLSSCDCGSACSKCLKHYRNQYVHGMLDRFAALQLLEWGVDGIKASPIKPETQINMIMPLANILKQSGCEITADSEITATGRRIKKKIVIYPAMWVEPHATSTIFVSDAYIKYAKPYAVQKILDNI